jgi:hypothetical protein
MTDTSGRVPRWPTIGLNGVDLQKKWKEDPAAYLSAIANDMPNYFVYMVCMSFPIIFALANLVSG